jgi:hypothetical protein
MVRKTVLILLAAALMADAQGQKNWKDRAEYDLYQAITSDGAQASRLENLDRWKSQYPQSEYADVRLRIYLLTYQQLNNHRGAFDTAGEILNTDANDLGALAEIINHGLQLLPEQPNASLSEGNRSDLETIKRVSRYVEQNIDRLYAIDKKPQRMSVEQWSLVKTKMRQTAQDVMNRADTLVTQK